MRNLILTSIMLAATTAAAQAPWSYQSPYSRYPSYSQMYESNLSQIRQRRESNPVYQRAERQRQYQQDLWTPGTPTYQLQQQNTLLQQIERNTRRTYYQQQRHRSYFSFGDPWTW